MNNIKFKISCKCCNNQIINPECINNTYSRPKSGDFIHCEKCLVIFQIFMNEDETNQSLKASSSRQERLLYWLFPVPMKRIIERRKNRLIGAMKSTYPFIGLEAMIQNLKTQQNERRI